MRLGSARIGAGSGSGFSRQLAGAAATLNVTVEPIRSHWQHALEVIKDESLYTWNIADPGLDDEERKMRSF